MLHVLPPTFKPVNNLFWCKKYLMRVAKRATLLCNSFCNNVAKQVACFLLPVFRTLSVADTKGYLVQCKQICDSPL